MADKMELVRLVEHYIETLGFSLTMLNSARLLALDVKDLEDILDVAVHHGGWLRERLALYGVYTNPFMM